jgi:hypothetical protein
MPCSYLRCLSLSMISEWEPVSRALDGTHLFQRISAALAHVTMSGHEHLAKGLLTSGLLTYTSPWHISARRRTTRPHPKRVLR